MSPPSSPFLAIAPTQSPLVVFCPPLFYLRLFSSSTVAPYPPPSISGLSFTYINIRHNLVSPSYEPIVSCTCSVLKFFHPTHSPRSSWTCAMLLSPSPFSSPSSHNRHHIYGPAWMLRLQMGHSASAIRVLRFFQHPRPSISLCSSHGPWLIALWRASRVYPFLFTMSIGFLSKAFKCSAPTSLVKHCPAVSCVCHVGQARDNLSPRTVSTASPNLCGKNCC